MSVFFRRRLRQPVPELDLRSVIGLSDPVHWFERAKLEKRTRYVMTQRDLEIARGRAALDDRDHFRRKHEEPREQFLNPDEAYADAVCQPDRWFR